MNQPSFDFLYACAGESSQPEIYGVIDKITQKRYFFTYFARMGPDSGRGRVVMGSRY
jgi:hypothetical protein